MEPLRSTTGTRSVSSCSSLGWPAGWPHLYLGAKNSGSPNAWSSDGVIWHQLRDATLWIQRLCNPATLQPVSLGGHRGHSSHGGRGPRGHPLEPPLTGTLKEGFFYGDRYDCHQMIAGDWLVITRRRRFSLHQVRRINRPIVAANAETFRR